MIIVTITTLPPEALIIKEETSDPQDGEAMAGGKGVLFRPEITAIFEETMNLSGVQEGLGRQGEAECLGEEAKEGAVDLSGKAKMMVLAI